MTAEHEGAAASLLVVLVPDLQTPAIAEFEVLDEVIGGAEGMGEVTLSAPAPAGGVTILLAGSRPDLVTVPASVMFRRTRLPQRSRSRPKRRWSDVERWSAQVTRGRCAAQ